MGWNKADENLNLLSNSFCLWLKWLLVSPLEKCTNADLEKTNDSGRMEKSKGKKQKVFWNKMGLAKERMIPGLQNPIH